MSDLQKLQIVYETNLPAAFPKEASLVVMFNPDRLQFKRGADWNVTNISGQVADRERHVFEFKATRPVELTFDLFFDFSKEEEMSEIWLMPALIRSWAEREWMRRFLERLEKLERLIQVDPELHRPPYCKLLWGKQLLLKGVLTSLSRNTTSFNPAGAPTRAEFSCTFTAVTSSRELHSSDVAKRRVIRQGDTLHSIAHEEYGEASLWRTIARENGISNPLQLVPGTRLIIPPLK